MTSLLAAMCALKSPAISESEVILAAREQSLTIERLYSTSSGYCDEVGADGKQSRERVYLWGLAVQLSSLSKALAVDPKFAKPLFDRAAKSLDAYFNKSSPTPGFAVLPGQGKAPDRYYDDNAWVALALQEAEMATGDATDKMRAQRALTFAASGWDDALGGGYYWREKEKKSKNTCSNAPTALALLVQGRCDPVGEGFATQGRQVLSWCKRLQDADGLYFDNVNLKGEIEKTKWTYNTALVIRANAALATQYDEAAAAVEAIRVGKAALAHWVSPDGAVHDEACFAHHLVDAFLDLDRIDHEGPWLQAAERAVESARRDSKGPGGLFGHRWDRRQAATEKKYKLLAQASMARALWSLAAAKLRRGDACRQLAGPQH